MLGTKSPEKEPDVGGREEKKSVQLLPRGEKNQGLVPSLSPSAGRVVLLQILAKIWGGGNVNKTEGKKVLVDPSHSPKNLEISRVWYSYLGGAPKELNLKS